MQFFLVRRSGQVCVRISVGCAQLCGGSLHDSMGLRVGHAGFYDPYLEPLILPPVSEAGGGKAAAMEGLRPSSPCNNQLWTELHYKVNELQVMVTGPRPGTG